MIIKIIIMHQQLDIVSVSGYSLNMMTNKYLVEQTDTGVTLGTYTAESPEAAILAMLTDAGADCATPDRGLRATLVVSTDYTVRLDVSSLSGSSWDDWCDSGAPEGVTVHAVQQDGYEHWTVSAATVEGAREYVEAAVGDYEVSIVDIAEDGADE